MAGSSPVRVVIADRSELTRAALRCLLGARSDIRIVGEAPDGAQALHTVLALQPQVVMLDRLLDADPVGVGRRVRSQAPAVQVLVYGIAAETGLIPAALNAGVRGFVDRETDTHHLVDALRRLAAGGLAVSPGLVQSVTRAYAALLAEGPPSDSSLNAGLSPRERETLSLIATGCSNRAVGLRLGLSENTVRAHLRAAFRKLGARNRVHAVHLLLAADIPVTFSDTGR